MDNEEPEYCIVCFETYSERNPPIDLEICIHSVCKGCLFSMQKTLEKTCPICKKTFEKAVSLLEPRRAIKRAKTSEAKVTKKVLLYCTKLSKKFKITVDLSDSIYEFKRRVLNIFDLKYNKTYFTYKGKMFGMSEPDIDNERYLYDYNILENSTVSVLTKFN